MHEEINERITELIAEARSVEAFDREEADELYHWIVELHGELKLALRSFKARFSTHPEYAKARNTLVDSIRKLAARRGSGMGNRRFSA